MRNYEKKEEELHTLTQQENETFKLVFEVIYKYIKIRCLLMPIQYFCLGFYVLIQLHFSLSRSHSHALLLLHSFSHRFNSHFEIGSRF